MKDQLPRKIRNNESGVINLDNYSGPGTHWTAYRKKGLNIHYFDSFGNLSPPFEVQNYFESSGTCNVFYNYTRYQSYNSVNCGHLCIQFLYNCI